MNARPLALLLLALLGAGGPRSQAVHRAPPAPRWGWYGWREPGFEARGAVQAVWGQPPLYEWSVPAPYAPPLVVDTPPYEPHRSWYPYPEQQRPVMECGREMMQ